MGIGYDFPVMTHELTWGIMYWIYIKGVIDKIYWNVNLLFMPWEIPWEPVMYISWSYISCYASVVAPLKEKGHSKY